MGRQVEETQETYAAIAAEYARRTGDADGQLLADVEVLARSLPPGGTVADVGCGPGRDVELLRSRGLRTFGFDMSMEQLRARGVPGVVRADMRRLPLRPAAVDAVWCRAALLHIPRVEVRPVLERFADVIRGGGWLFLAVAEGDTEGWERAVKYNSDRRRWFTYHQEPELTAVLGRVGFQVRRVVRTSGNRDWLTVHAVREREQPHPRLP